MSEDEKLPHRRKQQQKLFPFPNFQSDKLHGKNRLKQEKNRLKRGTEKDEMEIN